MAEQATRRGRKRPTTPKLKANTTPELENARIAERAYFIFLEEGSTDEVENWLRAERELTVT